MKVILASKSPIKELAARVACRAVFPGESIDIVSLQVPSGVSKQPEGIEVWNGAVERLWNAQRRHPEADLWISMEGGIFRGRLRVYSKGWILASDQEDRNFVGSAETAGFEIPRRVVEMLDAGYELSEAFERYFKVSGLKETKGGVSILTDGHIDRTMLLAPAAIIALSQLRRKEWYR